MPLTETPDNEAWREFTELRCPVCKNAKAKNQSFCRPCYFKLDFGQGC